METVANSWQKVYNQSVLNLLELCRVCLNHSKETKPLFEPANDNLAEKITFCTGVKFIPGNNISSFICKSCCNNLDTAYKFKTTCLLSEESFKKLLDIPLKQETFEISNDVDDCSNNFDDFHVKDESTVFNDINVKKEDNSDDKYIPFKKTKRKKQTVKKKLAKEKGKLPKLKKAKEENLINLLCQDCMVEFETKEKFTEHKKQFHKEKWVCEICGKVFNNRASVYSHRVCHLPPKFQCDLCDYKATYRYDLVKHIRTHTDEKRYQCEFCTRSYHTISSLRDHLRRLHTVPQPRRYACHLCEKAFYDNNKLKRHLDTHNGIMRYECEICSSQFSRRNFWKDHLLKQHGIVTPRLRPGRKRYEIVSVDSNLGASGINKNEKF